MGREVSGTSVTMQGPAELLQLARWAALRQSTSTDLLRLVPRLERACEAARLVAVRNLARSRLRIGLGGVADRSFGFADLYAALRRARAETRRREAARPQPSAPAPAPTPEQDGTAARSTPAEGLPSAPQPRGAG